MKFEFNSDGFDGLLDDLKTFEIDCPECDHPIEVSLDDIGSVLSVVQTSNWNQNNFSFSSASSFAVLLSCFISLFNFFTLFRVFLYPVIFTLTVCITGFSLVFSSPLFLTRATF